MKTLSFALLLLAWLVTAQSQNKWLVYQIAFTKGEQAQE
jgi:hypothetical protein